MCSEEFSLTWDDHHSTLVGVFEKLLETSTLVDCTIAAEGQYLKAHKVVLSACSPYFELLFGQEHEKNPIVVLKDVKFRELKAIIDFIYRGKVKIPEDRLADFVDAAESLQVKGLGGEHRRDDSRKNTINNDLMRKRERRPSPVSNKRMRNDCFSAGDVSSLPLEIEVCEQTSKCKRFQPPKQQQEQQEQQQQQLLGSPSTSSAGVVSISSTSNGTISPVPFAPVIQSEQPCIDTNLLSSAGQPTYSSKGSESVLLDVASVVKVEPEPVSEVFLPEPECLIEPKKEMCVDEMSMLDCKEGATEEMTLGVHDQDSTNQYSDFPPMHGTLEEGSDNSFLAAQIAENISVQGADPKLTDAGGPLAAAKSANDSADGASAAGGRARKTTRDSVAAPADDESRIPRECRSSECDQASSSVSEKDRQSLTRSKNRSRKCPECSSTFSDTYSLKRHRRIHTNELPYHCEICGSAFVYVGDLRVHIRSHTGEKPYSCEQCDAVFGFSNDLLKHKRLRHCSSPLKLPSTTRAPTPKPRR